MEKISFSRQYRSEKFGRSTHILHAQITSFTALTVRGSIMSWSGRPELKKETWPRTRSSFPPGDT